MDNATRKKKINTRLFSTFKDKNKCACSFEDQVVYLFGIYASPMTTPSARTIVKVVTLGLSEFFSKAGNGGIDHEYLRVVSWCPKHELYNEFTVEFTSTSREEGCILSGCYLKQTLVSDRKVLVELSESINLNLAKHMKDISEELNNTKEYSLLSFNCKHFAKEVYTKIMEIIESKRKNDLLENPNECNTATPSKTPEKSPRTPGRSLSPHRYIMGLFSSSNDEE